MEKWTGRHIWEWVRNIALILICLGAVYFFYSQVQTPTAGKLMSWSGSVSLILVGDMSRSDYTRKELVRLQDFIKDNSGLLTRVSINVTRQDAYGELTDQSQLLYRIRAFLHDGTTLDLSVRRTTRDKLVDDMVRSLRKALEPLAHLARMPKGEGLRTIRNTP